jgi:hypothetical protein
MKTDRRREAHDDKPHWLSEPLTEEQKDVLALKDRPRPKHEK